MWLENNILFDSEFKLSSSDNNCNISNTFTACAGSTYVDVNLIIAQFGKLITFYLHLFASWSDNLGLTKALKLILFYIV